MTTACKFAPNLVSIVAAFSLTSSATAQSGLGVQLLSSGGEIYVDAWNGTQGAHDEFTFPSNTSAVHAVAVSVNGSGTTASTTADARIITGGTRLRLDGHTDTVCPNGGSSVPIAAGVADMTATFRIPSGRQAQIIARVSASQVPGFSAPICPYASVWLTRLPSSAVAAIQVGYYSNQPYDKSFKVVVGTGDYRIDGLSDSRMLVGNVTSSFAFFKSWVAMTHDSFDVPSAGAFSATLFGGSSVAGGLDIAGTAGNAGTLDSDFDVILPGSLAAELPAAEYSALNFSQATEFFCRWNLTTSATVAAPAQVTAGYDERDMLANTAETDLDLFRFDGLTWNPTFAVIDPGANTLTASVLDLGVFAIGRRGCVAPLTYCTPKVNSLGCAASLSTAGSPSATQPVAFVVTASNVYSQKSGIFFYGANGQAAIPFQGGFLCVEPPTRRTPIQSSGGSAAGDDCTGELSFDFNEHAWSGVDPQLQAGTSVDGQFWSRDPGASSGTNLTGAIHFTLCP